MDTHKPSSMRSKAFEDQLKIYDITPLISERIGVFPGDTPFTRRVLLDIEKGHNIGLSALNTTVHLGAHADAPNHYLSGARGIESRDLKRYLGRALVIEANVARGERITQSHLKTTEVCERMLVRTNSFPNADAWNSDFASYSPELIESWAKRGVKTIGIDTPSIDPESSKDLPSHAMVAKHDLSILEGLVLTGVPEGFYTLIALPLKIENADASPVRAILIADEGKAFD
jgi:arylformamidase